MTSASANNKRIAKNTLLLYVRMLFLMSISFYTSRVVLNALGVMDYGIYNVVGGFIAMFSLLSGSLSVAISRFITFELGKNDLEQLKRVFSTSVTIQIAISLIIVILIETVGVWFLNTQMTIPEERRDAVNIVFQLSIISFVVGLISVPYNACIIAHEKMSAFAYISILEAMGKLLVAFLIIYNPIDRLVFYAILLVAIAVIMRIVYGLYCNRYFQECSYHFLWDKSLLQQMFGFTGWNFIGSIAGILRNQGSSILLNIFYGVVINAAQGLALQVMHAVTNFVNAFTTALNPQITKSYAKGDMDYSIRLVEKGSKYAFFLVMIIAIPFFVNTNFILQIWLHEVPKYTVIFVRLTLLLIIVEVPCYPLITLQLATGKIKKYQIVVGTLHMLNFPISFVFLYMGFAPDVIYWVMIFLAIICYWARILMLRVMVRFSFADFFQRSIKYIITVGIYSGFVVVLMKRIEQSLLSIIITIVVIVVGIYVFGLNVSERKKILKYIKSRI